MIEVAGHDAGTQYDQLIVTGTATLGGTLHVIPLSRDSALIPVEPITANAVLGSFEKVIVEATSGRETYTVTPIETGIQISPTTIEPTTFNEFQDVLFSESDVADEDIGSTTSDPDGDEFSNLLEYAMDLNPWVINENPMIVEFEPDEIAGFDGVTVTFPWAKNMTDVSYVIQISSDMSAWSNLLSAVTDTIDEGTHELITVSAEIDPPVTEGLFVRILVTQNEL